MSTKTKTTAPKQGTVAAAHQRIAELEAIVRKMGKTPTKCACKVATLEAVPETRQYTARVYHPNFGQALPTGVGYHDYVSLRLKDEIIQDKTVSPSEEEVMALLRIEAHEQFPNHLKIELSDISLLPAGWE